MRKDRCAPTLMGPHSTPLTGGLCGAVLAPQSGVWTMSTIHGKELQKNSEHPIRAGCKALYQPTAPPPNIQRSEDNREPSPAVCLLLLKSQFSNLQPTTALQIPRPASVTFKALHDLAPIYFSCRDLALTMAIPLLWHTPPDLTQTQPHLCSPPS